MRFAFLKDNRTLTFNLTSRHNFHMKFGGLSETEVSKISNILNVDGIPFTVDKDLDIEEFNSHSMKNDLRHYTPPNISTHILAITIDDKDFHKLSESGRSKLLDFGITDLVPSPEDFQPYAGESIHKELVDGPRRMVAFNFKHQLIFGVVVLIAYYIFRNG